MKRLFSGLAVAVLIGALVTAPATGAAKAETFESPAAALDAVIAALRANDADALIAIFGEENRDVVLSDDPARNRDDWGSFLRSHDEMERVVEEEDGVARIYVGRDQWPFPIDIVRNGDQWAFDAAGARDAVRFRRIGRNELDVIELLRAYARVQARYRLTDYDGDAVMEYANGILSSPGKRDGLYWPPEPSAPESPIGDFVARAAAIGYHVDGVDQPPEPYLGYYFAVLDRQGPSAPGGEMSYVVNGNMVAGHAMLAFPADYGDTGVMSFMVAENGVVYEADLGDDTLEQAEQIESFDPGSAWTPVR